MIRKVTSLVVALTLLLQQIGFAQFNVAQLHLGSMPAHQPPAIEKFRPVHLRYFSYDTLKNEVKVLLDKGDQKDLSESELDSSTKELMNYFLVGLALPNDKFWVNLRPDAEDQIIDPDLEKTDLGKIMLEADLQLKKDTASATSPQTPEGREYWNRLYQKAAEIYGQSNVSIPTLTRPWIVPNEIIVRETSDSAYVYKATLTVMLEQDYLKTLSGSAIAGPDYSFKDERAKALNEYATQLVKELILPKLTREVNISKKYAALRQVFYSLIMSRWFKMRFAGNTANSYAKLIDSNNLTGLASGNNWDKMTYFDAYKKSFAQGEYNLQESVNTPTGQTIRSYLSGGIQIGSSAINIQNNTFSVQGKDTMEALTRGAGFVQRNIDPSGSSALVAGDQQKRASADVDQYDYHIAINGARGRMGLLYLHSLLYDERYADMGVVALNGVPLQDLDDFIAKVSVPDSTYRELFPGAQINVLERNEKDKYAVVEINGQKILILNDRAGAIRWDLAAKVIGSGALSNFGIIETSGQNLEYQKSMDVHIASVPEGLVVFGAPPKDNGTPIIVLGVNEDAIRIKSSVISNASCTTNAIAPVANKVHQKYTVTRGSILTIHAETSDQTAYDTFRGDEAARARTGHKVQSAAKTGAAKLLPKIIPGIGPHDGKAIRVGTLTGSVVVYTAQLAEPATAQELRELFIQAEQENPRVFGTGRNLASKHIVMNTHSTIVDLDSIEVSEDGKTIKIATWYDNEYGYHKRGLDLMKEALDAQVRGERTQDFALPTPAAKAQQKEIKTVPLSELEGFSEEGALPVPVAASKPDATGRADLYLTGIKEKQPVRYGQILLRMLLGDPRYNVRAIVVDGIKKENFDATMKAFAQSIIYSTDLGNLEGLTIKPVLTEKGDMYLLFTSGKVHRLLRVLPALPDSLERSARILDVNQINFSYGEMVATVTNSLKDINAELLSAVISMSTRPGGELLDSGKGVSVPANILPIKIGELDNAGILYQAYQAPVNSGSYLVANFSIKGDVDKKTIDKLIKGIPGMAAEGSTSSHFVANRANIIYDESQTLLIPDAKEGVTLATLFFLVNEEVYAANKALNDMYPYSGQDEAVSRMLASSSLGVTPLASLAELLGMMAKAGRVSFSSEGAATINYAENVAAEDKILAHLMLNEYSSFLMMYATTASEQATKTNKWTIDIPQNTPKAEIERRLNTAYGIKQASSSLDAKTLREQVLDTLQSIGDEIRAIVNAAGISEDELEDQKSDFARKLGIDLATDEGRSIFNQLFYAVELQDDKWAMQFENNASYAEGIKALVSYREKNLGAASSGGIAAEKATGGIDFRGTMGIKYEPMGVFGGLDFSLPKLSDAVLLSFDLDQEASNIAMAIDNGTRVSGERVKEFIAACQAKGEFEQRRSDLIVWLAKLGVLEEMEYCDENCSNSYKEALVIADSPVI